MLGLKLSQVSKRGPWSVGYSPLLDDCTLLSSSLSPKYNTPDSKVHWANMGPTWVLSAPDAPLVGPINLAIRDPIAYLSWQNEIDLEQPCCWNVYWEVISSVSHWQPWGDCPGLEFRPTEDIYRSARKYDNHFIICITYCDIFRHYQMQHQSLVNLVYDNLLQL